MRFMYRYIVRKHERGLLFKDGDFESFLAPGTYRYTGWQHSYAVEIFDITQPTFQHSLQNYLYEAERENMEALFHVVETSATEAAVVYLDQKAKAVLGPGERAFYWRGVATLEVSHFDLSELTPIDSEALRNLHDTDDLKVKMMFKKAAMDIPVESGQVALLYDHNVLMHTLPTGTYAFWRFRRQLRAEFVDLRVQTMEVQGQEILTRDKVSLRINLTGTWRYTDAEKAIRELRDPLDQLYKEMQFALRAAVGTRTLDALLGDKTVIDREVAEAVQQRFTEFGIDVSRVGVKDIILPGDMKELLGKVVEAEKVAQANIIRRREETNATRSLLNTAKVMESNPVALRLKELETLERVTENVGNLSVYGGLDGVMNELVRLKQ